MKDIDKTGWWVSEPSEGIIEVISEKTGRTVCYLELEDYDSVEDAKTMAQIFAALPKALDHHLLVKLILLMPDDL